MIRFLIPEPRNRRSGGTLYDLQMVDALQKKNCSIKIEWISKKKGIENLTTFSDSDYLLIDGLVFHQNPKEVYQLERFNKIYVSHLPFWLEPGITANEMVLRKSREVEFLKNCKRVVCTSNFIRHELIKNGIPDTNIVVINPQISSIKPKGRTYNEQPVELLVVGGIHFGKGLDVLLKALNQHKIRNWNLKIAGYFNPDDAYYKMLNRTIDENKLKNKIAFIGECQAQQLKELYIMSDLLIHPSRFESYGMAIKESLSHGLPVIASDAGALPSVFKSAPIRFFKSENSESLSDVLNVAFNSANYNQMCSDTEHYNYTMEGKTTYNKKIDELIAMIL